MNDVEERFWARVAPGNWRGCRLWLGCSNDSGYGIVKINGRTLRAHRVAWEFVCGPVEPGAILMHKCDVKKCVNPDHLSVGTCAQNSADMVRKGRSMRGEKSHRARLSVADVVRIRSMVPSRTAKSIAADFGVATSTVWKIANGETWRHIPHHPAPHVTRQMPALPASDPK